MALFKDILKKNKQTTHRHGFVNLGLRKPDPGSAELTGDETSSLPAILNPSETSPVSGTAASQQKQRLETVSRSSRPKQDLLSCRYELKYRITEGKARAIKAYVQNFLPMDRYAVLHPEGQYPISSLYLDSGNLDLCKETLSGKANRFKLRIRAYDDNPENPVFFEIKRRVDKVILKSRARVERPHLASVLNGSMRYQADCPAEQEALDQFLYYKQVILGRPVVLVRYQREPFEGQGDHRVRVTFDRQLCYKKVTAAEVVMNGHGWHRIPIPFVILEIKFTNNYPAWLRRMVHVFNLNRSSMSKYVTSVKESKQAGLQTVFPYYLE